MSRHKNRYGLTPKQDAFCHAYIKLGSVSDAYRESYNCEGMKDASIRVEGSKLLASPNVSQRLDGLRQEKEKDQRLESVSLRSRIIESLLTESEMSDNPMARIKALELLGKTVNGFFVGDKVEIDQTTTINKSEQELEKAVATALADGNVVRLLKK